MMRFLDFYEEDSEFRLKINHSLAKKNEFLGKKFVFLLRKTHKKSFFLVKEWFSASENVKIDFSPNFSPKEIVLSKNFEEKFSLFWTTLPRSGSAPKNDF